MTDNKHAEAVEAVARIVCRAVDGDPDAMDAIDDGGQRIPMWRIFVDDAEEILTTIAALNTRPDVEADMRERCARCVEGDWIAGSHVRARIATAIRQLPLSNEGESRG